MKIAIIGAGAMGSIYASFLAQNNNEVLAIDLWEEHLEAIRKDGLRVSGFSGDNVVKNINVSNNIEDAKGYELFVIATKASGVGSAASNLSKIISKNSLILTIQNGLGAGERIANFMPTDNILLGVAQGFGAAMVSPGHAHHNNMSMIRIGEMNGGITQRLEKLVKVWSDAGFNAKAFEDIEQLIWEKFICNVAYSGPCSIFRKTLGEVMGNKQMFEVAKGCSLSGFASFVAWAGSVPAQIYLLKLGVNRKNFVGIMSFYFFLINFSKIPFYLDLKIFTNESLFLSFLLIPVLPIGIFLGKWLNLKLSDNLFYNISHVALFLCGIHLIIKNAT